MLKDSRNVDGCLVVNQECRKDIRRIEAVDAMPGKDFVLKMTR
jgi:hypothetical protein